MAARQGIIFAGDVYISVNYVCDRTKEKATKKVSIYDFKPYGGCSGHDDGQYCYCPSPFVDLEINDCPSCHKQHTVSGD